jgi:hypothetical protein
MCRRPESNCEHIQSATACFRVITQLLRRAARVWSSDGFGHVEACCKRRDVADWTVSVSDLDVSSFRVRCCGWVFWGRNTTQRGGVP